MSSCPDCIFEIDQLWQSGFSRFYSNCCCSCSFELEIIKIGQSSHKMYSNNILNFEECTTILNACTKIVWKLIECTIHEHFLWFSIWLYCLSSQVHLPMAIEVDKSISFYVMKQNNFPYVLLCVFITYLHHFIILWL